MKKLMVLDGNSIVNRAFYGVSQNLTTRDGPAHQCGVRLSGHPEQAAGRVRTSGTVCHL